MFKKVLLPVFLVMLIGISACECKKSRYLFADNPDKTIATVNGMEIKEKDIDPGMQHELKKVQGEIFKMKMNAINDVIDEKLLEIKAKAQNQTVEEMLNDYYKQNIKEPNEKDIKAYYEFSKKKVGDKEYAEVKEKVIAFIRANQESALKRKLLRSLRKEANIEFAIEVPRTEIEFGESPSRGKQEAPVTIVEYADLQCTQSGDINEIITKIINEYGDSIYYVFKDFPLDFHANAQKAHEATYCAKEENKYWEMLELLFKNQTKLSTKNIKNYAKKLGLNMEFFNKCLDKGVFAEVVRQNYEYGKNIGVGTTPTIFINGIMLTGKRPYSTYKKLIDLELERKK